MVRGRKLKSRKRLGKNGEEEKEKVEEARVRILYRIIVSYNEELGHRLPALNN